jgi:hypothetical protein
VYSACTPIFFNPKPSYQLWTADTMVVWEIMLNCKEINYISFLDKLKILTKTNDTDGPTHLNQMV